MTDFYQTTLRLTLMRKEPHMAFFKLVHTLVHMLGGSISFVSEEKNGTTFTVMVPNLKA